MKKIIYGVIGALASLGATAATSTFNYTGAQQVFVVPAGVTSVNIDAQGASGWSGDNSGGLGGSASGDLAVTPGETLYIYVGGQGTVANGNFVPGGGGFNGGGNGQSNSALNSVGGGGGATDLRQGGTALANRVLVAGGGGGSTDNTGADGGDGGGLVGEDGALYSTYPIGTGGSQVAGGTVGGALGQGGSGDGTMTPWNGGGGGGYYGGGVSTAHAGGGGGSSYLDGVSGGATTQGVQSGDGAMLLTYLSGPIAAPEPVPTMGIWGIGILTGIISLLGMYHRRRK